MLGALVIAFSAILVDLADVTPATAAVWRCAYALPAARRDRVVRSTAASGPARRANAVATAAGMLFAIDILVWHYAIRDVGAGLATVLGNLQVVVVPFLALAVLGERVPRGSSSRCRPSAPASCWCPARSSTAPTARTRPAACCSASRPGSPTRRSCSSSARARWTCAARRARCSTCRWWRRSSRSALGLAIGVDDLVPTWPSAGWLITLALTSQVLGWLLIRVSLPRLPAAMTSIILTIQPIGSVALGAILLGQEPSVLQLCGVALILSA